MTQQKRPTKAERVQGMRRDFEEMQEQSKRLRNQVIEKAIREADESGEIARRAQERGIDYGDALVEFAEEVEAPFLVIDRKHERQRLEREFGGPLPGSAAVVTLEEECRGCGLDAGEVKAYARRHDVDPLDAMLVLAEERGGEEVVATPRTNTKAVELDERVEEDLDRKTWAYVRKHGLTYEQALTKLLEEEGA